MSSQAPIRGYFNHDSLMEDRSVQEITNCAVGLLPHLLEVEFLDSLPIGSDRGSLNGNLAGFDGVIAVKSDLIVAGVTVLGAQLEVGPGVGVVRCMAGLCQRADIVFDIVRALCAHFNQSASSLIPI